MVFAGHKQNVLGDEVIVHVFENDTLVIERSHVESLHATPFRERFETRRVETDRPVLCSAGLPVSRSNVGIPVSIDH